MSIGSEIPANAGVYRPIARRRAPPGSVVNARSPAPVANRMAVGHRVVNAVMGAFARALPGRGARELLRRELCLRSELFQWRRHAAGLFRPGMRRLGRAPGRRRRQRIFLRLSQHRQLAGGDDRAELSGDLHPLCPVAGSGGAGRHRGGLGLTREFRLDAPGGEFAANLDRFKVAPYGLEGGEPGRPGRLLVRRGDGPWQALPSKVVGVALAQGDHIRLETAGGGGYGHVAERDAAAIETDRREGYVEDGGPQVCPQI